MIQPENGADLIDAVVSCPALNIRGGGSKCGMWDQPGNLPTLDMRRMAGIVAHDPDELVITVRAGTLLTEVEHALARHDQMLAFEPFDHGPLFGRPAGGSTIGGIVAGNVAGSRRVSAGAARDHVLGFEAVSGRAEAFKGGGKVVKNVTGYDLPRLMAGSWGSLAVLSEITLRVMPAPKAEQTLLFDGLDDGCAITAMNQALSLPASVSGAARLDGVTALRIEGFAPAVEAQVGALRRALARFGDARLVAGSESREWWQGLASFGWVDRGNTDVWRVIVPPAAGAAAGEAIGGRRVFDWGGGLIWVERATARDVPGIARSFGGHARLVRSDDTVSPFVCSGEAAALHERIKLAFDPGRRLNPGVRLVGAG